MYITRLGCLLNILFMFILRLASRTQYHNPYFIAKKVLLHIFFLEFVWLIGTKILKNAGKNCC